MFQKKLKHTSIAFVYDRVNTRYGGAEKVLQALLELFPQAPLYTSVYDKGQVNWIQENRVVPSFVQHIPFAKNHHREFVWLMPYAFETFDFSNFDIIISITSAEAKGIITSSEQLHICYLLTPTRYLWSHKKQYEAGMLSPLKKYIFSNLREWDYIAAQRPDHIIPISRIVQQRCEKYYKRKTEKVLYPLVETPSLQSIPTFKQLISQLDLKDLTLEENNFFLVVSRLVSYKNIDVIIEAFSQPQLKHERLVIVGDGPEKSTLQKRIEQQKLKERIVICSHISEEALSGLYQYCKAVFLPSREDFGIVALEANSFGKPVILHAQSGAAEVIPHGKCGIHFETKTIDDIMAAIQHFIEIQWNEKILIHNAQKYTKERFQKIFFNTVEKLYKQHATRL